jgi:phosphatidylglycerophosphatase A
MPAPGTWGSGAGLLLYLIVFARVNKLEQWAVFLGMFTALAILAMAICTVAEKRLGKTDPREIILDEFIAMPLIFAGTETTNFLSAQNRYAWAWFLAGFALFRILDVSKPLGIRKLQSWPGGAGIVADDIAAALAACLALHVLHWATLFANGLGI